MKVCEYCVTTVLENKLSWDYHNHSYDALTPLPKDRCVFCAQLREDVKQVSPSLSELDYTTSWPVYRWSIRSLAQIRESPETVVVTFRYVSTEKVPGRSRSSNERELVNLPTRIFYLFPDKDLQPLPAKEELGKTTDPKHNGTLLRKWVQRCDSTHTDCARLKKATPKAKQFIPTRLLDISGPPGSPIKVIETATTTIQGPYCSLSHCWGLLLFTECTLRDYNKEQFMTEGVAWNFLTTNFQQAIEIARSLDVSYIWIDSMCIIQGSAEDWKHEASRMHQVYRNSYCNIAIVDSADKNGGAYRTREPENIIPTLYVPKGDPPMFGRKTWRVLQKDMWDTELLQSYLYVRAWVFQGALSAWTANNTLTSAERMLAPRILHFAKNQIFWDCPSLSACEALPNGLPRPMDTSAGPDRHWKGRLQLEGDEDVAGPNDQPLSTFWQTAVRKYTRCNITKRSDKLIAIRGIAKLVKDRMGVEYGEGLWEGNLEDQLAWRVAECQLVERPITEGRKIPSWSWASMDGEIIIADRLSDKGHRTVCDHNGHDLELDLKGVKRYARSSLPRRASGPIPRLQHRVQSDSVLEIKQSEARSHQKEPHNDHSGTSEVVDEDAEPTLHSHSIALQGHINSGTLEFSDLNKAWTLRLSVADLFRMDAYPDTLPGLTESSHLVNFVVLSVKKTLTPRIISNDADMGETVEFEGRGILLEPVGQGTGDRFRRVGAFDFRGADVETFNCLLTTAGWQKLPPQEFDTKLGRKIWLD